jgi:hypothetical protein
MPCDVDRVGCCISNPEKGTCIERDLQFLQTSLATAVVVDDDGDPLDLATVASGGCLTSGAAPAACVGPACDPVLTMCGNRSFCGEWTPAGGLSVDAHDGLARATGAIAVEGVCSP